MPDANKENTLNQLVGAAFGAAGQRCMALSTAILVGDAQHWLPELVERAKSLRVNAGILFYSYTYSTHFLLVAIVAHGHSVLNTLFPKIKNVKVKPESNRL